MKSHSEISESYESWYEYYAEGKMIYCKNSKGNEEWYEYHDYKNGVIRERVVWKPCNIKKDGKF